MTVQDENESRPAPLSGGTSVGCWCGHSRRVHPSGGKCLGFIDDRDGSICGCIYYAPMFTAPTCQFCRVNVATGQAGGWQTCDNCRPAVLAVLRGGT